MKQAVIVGLSILAPLAAVVAYMFVCQHFHFYSDRSNIYFALLATVGGLVAFSRVVEARWGWALFAVAIFAVLELLLTKGGMVVALLSGDSL